MTRPRSLRLTPQVPDEHSPLARFLLTSGSTIPDPPARAPSLALEGRTPDQPRRLKRGPPLRLTEARWLRESLRKPQLRLQGSLCSITDIRGVEEHLEHRLRLHLAPTHYLAQAKMIELQSPSQHIRNERFA